MNLLKISKPAGIWWGTARGVLSTYIFNKNCVKPRKHAYHSTKPTIKISHTYKRKRYLNRYVICLQKGKCLELKSTFDVSPYKCNTVSRQFDTRQRMGYSTVALNRRCVCSTKQGIWARPVGANVVKQSGVVKYWICLFTISLNVRNIISISISIAE